MRKTQFEGIAPWLQTAWDFRAAGNFIGGGSGTGLLLAAALAALVGAPSALALVGGLALVGLGLISVFLEIGRPLRAINVMFNPFTSWMTREAFVAGLLFPVGGAVLWWPELVPVVAIPAAAYLYCQARILKAAKGIPAWREPMIVPMVMTSGLAEGAGFFVLATGGGDWAAALLLGTLCARALAWIAYRRALTAPGRAPVQAAQVLHQLSLPFTLGGHAAPALLLVAGGLSPPLALPAQLAAALAAIAGGWALKLVIVTRAAQNQGFAIPVSPTRGGGTAGPGNKPGWGLGPANHSSGERTWTFLDSSARPRSTQTPLSPRSA